MTISALRTVAIGTNISHDQTSVFAHFVGNQRSRFLFRLVRCDLCSKSARSTSKVAITTIILHVNAFIGNVVATLRTVVADEPSRKCNQKRPQLVKVLLMLRQGIRNRIGHLRAKSTEQKPATER